MGRLAALTSEQQGAPFPPAGSSTVTHVLEEEVELWVAAWVHCDLKQGHEDVLQHLLEVSQLLLGVVDITASTHKWAQYLPWSNSDK